MIPNGKPENLSPVQRTEIVASFKTRKLVRHILHGFTLLFVAIGLIPYRMDMSLLGLSKGTELGIFLGIAAVVLGISILFWRCPYCGWHFLWRMDPKNCWNCGAQLVQPREILEDTGEKDYLHYIKVRQKNSVKFFLFMALIMIGDGFLFWFTIDVLPYVFQVIIFMGIFLISGVILDHKFHVYPRCGEKYTTFWSNRLPEDCPHCNTPLKHYHPDPW